MFASLPACRQSSDASASAAAADAADRGAVRYSLDDGIDICFRQVAAALGPEARVAELTSFFAAGERIDGEESDHPQGAMTLCTVDYADPRQGGRLLNLRMDPRTGVFAAPTPVTPAADAGETHLVALSAVQASKLQGFLDRQRKRLGRTYAVYAVEGVRLSTLGDAHVLRADVAGRLASGDARHSGDAALSLDGRRVLYNRLAEP
ncbi:hypothetical protein HF319_17585 [Xanthomonas sp. Kuri4-1]